MPSLRRTLRRPLRARPRLLGQPPPAHRHRTLAHEHVSWSWSWPRLLLSRPAPRGKLAATFPATVPDGGARCVRGHAGITPPELARGAGRADPGATVRSQGTRPAACARSTSAKQTPTQPRRTSSNRSMVHVGSRHSRSRTITLVSTRRILQSCQHARASAGSWGWALLEKVTGSRRLRILFGKERP